MHVVAAHRGATLETLIPALDGMPSMAQAKWSLWRGHREHGVATVSESLSPKREYSPEPPITAMGAVRLLTLQCCEQRWQITAKAASCHRFVRPVPCRTGRRATVVDEAGRDAHPVIPCSKFRIGSYQPCSSTKA